MKYLFLFLSLSSLLCVNIYAQPNFGIKLGASCNTIEDVYSDGKGRVGKDFSSVNQLPNVGIFLEQNIHRLLGYELSIMYQPKGVDTGAPRDTETYLRDNSAPHDIVRLSYLSLPLNVTLFPEKRFNFYGGVSGAFLLNTPYIGMWPDETLNQWELAWQFGIRYNFKYFSLHLQYLKAFSPWFDNNAFSNNGMQYYNKGWQATLSVPINKLF